jgi:hypothetical protein
MILESIAQKQQLTLNQKYLDVDLPSSKLLVVTSPMGSGKSTWIKNCIKSQAVYLTPRIALGAQMATKYKAIFYKDVCGEISGDKIVISVDSLPRLLFGDNYIDKTVVIDEYGLLSKHLTGHTCKANRIYIIQTLQLLLHNAKQIILLDAHYYPDAIKFFQSLAEIEDEDVLHINNMYNPRDLKFIKYPDKHSVIAQIYKDAAAGHKCFVACDTKEQVEQLGQRLNDISGLRILMVHGDNSDQQEQQQFINNVNELQKNYDVVIASPSLSTGIDISEPWFEKVYLIANKYKATHQDLMQSVRRVRKVLQINFWINPTVSNLQEDAEWLRRRHEKHIDMLIHKLNRTHEEDLEALAYDICPVTGKLVHRVDAYSTLTYQIEANVNKSLNNLLENFIDEAERFGRVADARGITPKESDAMKAAMMEIKAELHEAKVEKILKAQPITEDEFDALKKKESLTEDEKWSVRLFKAHQLCGFDNNLLEQTVERLDEGLFKAVKLHRYRRASDEELLAQDAEDVKWRHRTDWGFRKATKDLMHLLEASLHPGVGLPDFEMLDTVIDKSRLIDKNQLSTFGGLCHSKRDEIKALLGLTVPVDVRDRPMQFLEMYVRMLGLELKFVKQPRINGKQIRQYALEQGSCQYLADLLQAREDYLKECRRYEEEFDYSAYSPF